jgi:hypothetical protein
MPDISMDAAPETGLKVGETQEFAEGACPAEEQPTCVKYSEYAIGGTSLASPLLAGEVADADQAAGHALGFLNPLLYQLAAKSSSSTAGSIYDVLAAGKQAQVFNLFLDGPAEVGLITALNTLGYEGPEAYCSGTGECEAQNVELHATPGFDSMTGVGSPGPEFVHFAATLKVAKEGEP